MKTFCILVLVISCVGISSADNLKCTQKSIKTVDGWQDMVGPCIEAMEKQVKKEMEASITYLAMGSHFAQDNKNRPGFSKFFFDSANEEREHAIKIIEYLLMRGQLTDDLSKLLTFPVKPMSETWDSGIAALKDALTLEMSVTGNIRNIIATCEKPEPSEFNDYHLVDYLTAEFLTEQYKGTRDIVGKLTTLKKMTESHGDLAEFLYDKKLLE